MVRAGRTGQEASGPRLTDAELGRALLARQHLVATGDPREGGPDLRRADGADGADGGERVVAEVRHLVGLQSQVPTSPYAGLWSRLPGFATGHLGDRLLDRSLVRVATLRGTVHLVTADDAFELSALTRPTLAAHLRARNEHGAALADVDLDDLADTARDLLAEPLTSVELGRRLAARWPAVDPKHLAYGARCLLPLVQVPPRGLWGASGPGTTTTWTTAHAWLGEPGHRSPDEIEAVASASDPEAVLAARVRLVRRYLAAFGPATVADVQRWSGLTRLRAAVDVLRPELVTATDTAGRELLDLPGAPRPAGDVPVPVVLVADFDNLVLAHDDRTRVLGAIAVKQVVSVNGQVAATVLVDGRVAGAWTWRVGREGDHDVARVDVRPLRPSAAPPATPVADGTGRAPADRLGEPDVRDEVVARAEDWLRVAAPEARRRVVVHR